MPIKASSPEDEYFAREEAEKLYKLQKDLERQRSEAETEALRKAHYMKCPKCGNDLKEIMFRDVKIDKCFSCGAIVLDKGELEHLAGTEHTVLKGFVKLFDFGSK